VAPLRRNSGGAITPQFWWRHYAVIEMAPYCRKFTNGNGNAENGNGNGKKK
jgi:hypothetical protein